MSDAPRPPRSLAFDFFPCRLVSQPETVVVFLGGILARRNGFEHVAKLLTSREDLKCAALTFDWTNHGESPRSDDFTLDTLADDVDHVLENVIPRELQRPVRTVLVGHSLGGTVGMTYIYRHHRNIRPARALVSGAVDIVGLVVLDIAPTMRSPLSRVPQFLQFMMNDVDLSQFESAEKVWQYAVSREAFPPGNETLRDYFFVQNIEKDPISGRLRWMCNLKPITSSVPNLAWSPFMDQQLAEAKPSSSSAALLGGQNKVPRVSFVFGSKSPYFPTGTVLGAQAITSQFFDPKDTEIRVVPDAGHFLHVDNFDSFMVELVQAIRWVLLPGTSIGEGHAAKL